MSGKGSDYRPITDTWLLAPSKVGYYGAYPNGFLQRARDLLCRMTEPLFHVCAGRARAYPGYGFGPLDKCLDINPAMEPDCCQDARDPWPTPPGLARSDCAPPLWPAILIDPPYTPADAQRYNQYTDPFDLLPPMESVLPTPAQLLERAWEVLLPGGKVGILHQFHPRSPAADARLVACIQVVQGTNQQPRCFTVFEKEWKPWQHASGPTTSATRN